MGSVSVETGHETAPYNTAIRAYLLASPNPEGGYYLMRWEDQNGVEIDGAYLISGDVTATAVFGYSDMDIIVFAAEYGDTASHQDTWGSIAISGVPQYTGEITLTASANPHYNFMGWSDGNADATRTFILTRDTLFYAFFAPDTHIVAFTNNYGTDVTLGGDGSYAYNSSIELTYTNAQNLRSSFGDACPEEAARTIDQYLASRSLPKLKRIRFLRRGGYLMQSPVTRLGQFLFG